MEYFQAFTTKMSHTSYKQPYKPVLTVFIIIYNFAREIGARAAKIIPLCMPDVCFTAELRQYFLDSRYFNHN